MKVVQYHGCPLSRQVGEVIKIQKRGITLNSRAEYNHCQITRLSLEQEDQGGEADMDTDWTIGMLENRDKVDGELRKSLGRVNRTESIKRKDDTTVSKMWKRRKYNLVGEDWGVTGRKQGTN